MAKVFWNLFHFVRSQIFLFQIKAPGLIKIKIILGALTKLFLKPLQFLNPDFYFRLRKNIISRIYKKINIKIQNKIFKIRDDIDLMTLLADEGINKFLQNKGGIFIDAGAHIGKYSILFSDFYEKIYAFEPEPTNFSILKDNIQLNHLDNKIIPLQLALSDKIGMIDFYLSPYSVTHSLKNLDKQFGKIYVNTTTFDIFVRNFKIPLENISCIKIDVEGAEDLVLKGMANSLFFLRSKIIIEIWKTNVENFNFISKFLKKYNFKLKKIKGDYYLAYYENPSVK